jgi:site-specific DNA-methyltransferase (adenine-specific)
MNYAKKDDKIFDSHMGSGSSIIACIEEGFDYIACELDKNYYKSACKRIEEYNSQGRLF